MIQVATFSGSDEKYNGSGVEQYSLHDIRSLDEYDINIIDLSSIHLWVNNNNVKTSINKMADLKSISTMITGSNSSEIIILLPQNISFRYGSGYSIELKDMLYELIDNILQQIYQPILNYKLAYENTKTCIENHEYKASFYFTRDKSIDEVISNPILKSAKSNKPTTIKLNKVYLTTLYIEDYNSLLSFLREIKLLKDREDKPEWIFDIKMFDDVLQEKIILDNNNKIVEAQKEIDDSCLILDKNNKLKSVLYTNGNELVEIIFEILEEMLGCDLSTFVDVKKEDVSFEIDGFTFIGEIKGVNHNVKNQNISQLEHHYQEYLDEHEDLDENNIKALLIINHQKSKHPKEREPIMEPQIELAKKYGSLIIDTYCLLKLLEKYRHNELSRDDIINLLKNNVGVLNI